MFCVVWFHRAHKIVRERETFKHLIASLAVVGANSPWGETGSYHLITLYKNLRLNMLWQSELLALKKR